MDLVWVCLFRGGVISYSLIVFKVGVFFSFRGCFFVGGVFLGSGMLRVLGDE